MAREMAALPTLALAPPVPALPPLQDKQKNVVVAEEVPRGGAGQGQGRLVRGAHWQPAGDKKLKELIARYGPGNWKRIAQEFQGRSDKSCRLRWFNQLDPRVNRAPFSLKEEERLVLAYMKHGPRWSLIAGYFPGRTDNAVKNHWHVMRARNRRGAPASPPPPPPSSSSSCPAPTYAPPVVVRRSPYYCFSPPPPFLRAGGLGVQGEGDTESSGTSNFNESELVPGTIAPPPSPTREEEDVAGTSGGAGEDCAEEGDKVILPFFDFLGIGET